MVMGLSRDFIDTQQQLLEVESNPWCSAETLN